MLPGSIYRENIPAPFPWQEVSLFFPVETCVALCKKVGSRCSASLSYQRFGVRQPCLASALKKEKNEREKERDDTRPGHNEGNFFSVEAGSGVIHRPQRARVNLARVTSMPFAVRRKVWRRGTQSPVTT